MIGPHGQRGAPRAIAIYGWLLRLYPRPYLQQHRAELLQNFEDLARASQSTTALWVFVGRDLALSIGSICIRTLQGQTAIVVGVLTVLLAYAARHPLAPGQPIAGFCCGYILGWFAGWFGEQWQAASVSRVPNAIRSLPAQAMIVVGALAFVIALAPVSSGTRDHVIWALSYGFLLAWIAGWIGNRRHTRL